MSRARWAAWGLSASLALTSGCCSLCNRPLLGHCCPGSCGTPACESCAEEVPVAGGPILQDYGTAPVVPGPAAALPPVALPPAPNTVPPLAPQPTVPPLSPPPGSRLVPQPAQPEPYHPGGV
jgi:hypothetical protein